jgi:hypothetical protein
MRDSAGLGFVRCEVVPRAAIRRAAGARVRSAYHPFLPAHAHSARSPSSLGNLRPARPGAVLPTGFGTRIGDGDGRAAIARSGWGAAV